MKIGEIEEELTFRIKDGGPPNETRSASFKISKLEAVDEQDLDKGYKLWAEWQGGRWGEPDWKIEGYRIPAKIDTLTKLADYLTTHNEAIV